MILTPTLWRTSRVLAGKTRLDLLRRILAGTGPGVSEFAAAAGLSEPRASQELRRLQSRGLLRAERKGAYVVYRPIPDPQVSSAKPILDAVGETFARFPSAAAEQIMATASGLSHARRVDLVRRLRGGAADLAGLQAAVPMPLVSLWRHLHELEVRGWAVREGRRWKIASNEAPLAACLLKLL